MKELDKITLKDFKDGIIHCLEGGLNYYAPLGSAGNNYLLYGKRTADEHRVSHVSLRLYNKDVELLLTDTQGSFLFYGRHHLSRGLDYISKSYYKIFRDNLKDIKGKIKSRPDVSELRRDMFKEYKKAFLVIPHWADDQSIEAHKDQSSAVYAETAGKAKYLYYIFNDMQDDGWFKYRALRWHEMDLFPPVLSEDLKKLPESAIKKMIHTYAADSNSPGYRNYYNGSINDEDFQILIFMGLAERNKSRDNSLSKGTTYFHLTEKGKKAIMTTRERRRCDIE